MLPSNTAIRSDVPLSATVVDYPRPCVPVLPVASWGSFLGRNHRCEYADVLQAGWSVDVTSGTAAIALALEQADIGVGAKVLLPAFHCVSMVEPFLAVRAQISYYRVAHDLSVDMDDLRVQLHGARALLVSHYFGFYQNMQALRALCDIHSVVLIEDCAHAFFGSLDGRPIGWYGDYAVASTRKFFPIQDGGQLVSSRHPLRQISLQDSGLAFNLKAGIDVIETATGYVRFVPMHILLLPLWAIRTWFWKALKARVKSEGNAMVSRGPKVSKGYKYMDLQWTHKRMAPISRWLLRHADKARIAHRRRQHYLRLLSGLSGLDSVRPLLPQLPDDVVPYMFPLVVANPERIFHQLKLKRLPLWRWEDLMTSHCEISTRYGQSLFQLPCHQSLTNGEIDWMIRTIRDVLSDVETVR